ncbi:MAG: hypothetical protein V3U19_07580 [Thermodesulfobacteriota bacterium]
MQNTNSDLQINIRPTLFLGTALSSGPSTFYDSELNVTLNISLADSIATTKFLYADEKSAIVIDAPRTEYLTYNRTFERVKTLQVAGDNEALAREGLYLIGSNFFMSSDFYTDGLADSFGLRWARAKPSIVFVTKENRVESFGGVPFAVENGGTSVDLKYDQVALSSTMNETVEFNLRRGLTVSGYEGTVLEVFYQNITGISTIEVLNRAFAENVPVYFITQDTLGKLDILSISSGDKEIIKNLLLQSPSYFAMVPAETITIGNWSGVGYAIIDGESGAGKYLLSGGLAGGATDRETNVPTMTCRRYLASIVAITGFALSITALCLSVIAGGGAVGGIAIVNFCYTTFLSAAGYVLIEDWINPEPGIGLRFILKEGYKEYCSEPS